MAVLGNRGTGILDMLIEGYRRSGVDMPQPNMSPVGRTPLQQTLNRPEVAISSMGNQMTTTMPDRTMVQASTVPMLQDVTRGRILDSNDPMRPVPEAMPMQQVAERQAARQPTPAPADPMGMQKLAEDASRAVAAGADESNDPTIMEGIKNYFGSRENMVRLALAFNSMRTKPDAGLASVLGGELETIGKNQLLQSRANATLEALRKAGVPEKDLMVLSNDPELLREYAKKFFAKDLESSPAEIRTWEMMTKGLSPEDIERARRIDLGLDPRAGSQYALGIPEIFERAAAQAGGTEKGKSEEERKQVQVQNDKTWNIWETAISGLEESLGNTPTGKIFGLLPAMSSSQQIADQAVSIMAPVLKNIFRESGEGVFTDKDQEILMGMVPDRGSNPETIAYAIKMINDIVAAKLNQQIKVEVVPNTSVGSTVLRFDAQGNPIQ